MEGWEEGGSTPVKRLVPDVARGKTGNVLILNED